MGDVIASKYRLDALLSEGGMGSVWQAFNVQLEAAVAIKVIRGEVDRELLMKRLVQEARAAAKLGHPAIVRVFDVGESEFGYPFIVMELLSGRSLGALLTAERRLPATRAVQLLLPVADALMAAHAKGIIHRDLKPDNIFLALNNEQIQPKLVDFGIVKLSEQSRGRARLTEDGTILGSPQYMSPEQARGREDLDHRTDVWSFCVVLYEAVSGQVPFSNPNYNALLLSIQTDPLPSLTELLAGDAGLWRIIERGLAKDMAERFQSVAELGEALALWLVSRGIFEDVCGGSLDAKWLARSTDALTRQSSRASLTSASSMTPSSGLHTPMRELEEAATLDAVRIVPAEDAAARQAGGRWLTLPRALLLAAAALLSLGVGIAAHKNSGAASAAEVAEPTAAAPTLAAAAHPPSAAPEPVSSAPAPETVVPNPPATKGSGSVAPRRVPGKSLRAAVAPQPVPNAVNHASGVLISPY